MPFTPFHLGPALGLGLPLRNYVHAPTFIFANVIIDVEPFLVVFFGFRYPLHGYLHTFLSALLAGLILGYVMFAVEKSLHPLYRLFLLEEENKPSLTSFLLAGSAGTMLHVLLDSPLYADIQPFYPITANPLYNPALSFEIYSLCVWLGTFGIVYYIGLLIFLIYRKFSAKKN